MLVGGGRGEEEREERKEKSERGSEGGKGMGRTDRGEDIGEGARQKEHGGAGRHGEGIKFNSKNTEEQ